MMIKAFERFQALKAARKTAIGSWDAAKFCLVEIYRRFSRAYCLHHQDDTKLLARKLVKM
jgi:hypothetical protein